MNQVSTVKTPKQSTKKRYDTKGKQSKASGDFFLRSQYVTNLRAARVSRKHRLIQFCSQIQYLSKIYAYDMLKSVFMDCNHMRARFIDFQDFQDQDYYLGFILQKKKSNTCSFVCLSICQDPCIQVGGEAVIYVKYSGRRSLEDRKK